MSLVACEDNLVLDIVTKKKVIYYFFYFKATYFYLQNLENICQSFLNVYLQFTFYNFLLSYPPKDFAGKFACNFIFYLKSFLGTFKIFY